MKALVGAFNQDMALTGAFSVIVKFSGNLREPSFKALSSGGGWSHGARRRLGSGDNDGSYPTVSLETSKLE